VPKNRLPAEVIDYWPEVLEDVDIKAIPVKYVASVHVTFNDGKSWDIDIDREKILGDESLEKTLDTFFKEYNDLIRQVEFKLDTPSLVNDVKSHTKTFMKRS
tara:strand:+ start:126 stop:431 length:306 start_codon:yes stop_codon:yes gene_type:complete